MPGTVLVVDDSPHIGTMFRDVLELEGYRSYYASSGAEALALLATMPRPELILVDCDMPGMSGEALIRAIRRDFPDLADKTFILGFSSHSMDSDVARRFEEVADGYSEKPWDIDSFLKLVQGISPRLAPRA